jgi:hypothetical protein
MTDDGIAYILIVGGIYGFATGTYSPTVSAIFLVGGLLMAKKPLNLW